MEPVPLEDGNGELVDVAFELIDDALVQMVQPTRSDTSSIARVIVGAAETVTLLAANPLRGGYVIHNDSDDEVLLSYGATSNALLFSFRMPPRTQLAYVEHSGAGVYSGVVTARREEGIADAPVLVTEWSRGNG